MNTIRSIVSIQSYRIPPRLKLISTRLGSLILLLQRMPVVQFLFPEANIIGGASVANTISLAVTTVVGLGVFDSVAGQSQINQKAPLNVIGTTPALNLDEPGNLVNANYAINVPATVSDLLTFKFNWDPLDRFSTVKSWRCTTGGVDDTLPYGLTPVGNSSSTVGKGGLIEIKGTPTTYGITPVMVTVYKAASYAEEYASQIFNICVLGFSTQPAASTTINSGETTTLNCTAAGIPSATLRHTAVPVVKYEWFQGAPPSETTPVGTNSPSFTTPSNLTSSTSYWVKVTSTLSGYAVSAKSSTAVVNVNPVSSPFETWASVLPEGQRGANQTPMGDGVTNLEKFAFNLNPLAPDVRHLTVGANNPAGLPGGAYIGGVLRLEFLRRKATTNPGITYTAQFGSDLGGWTDIPVGTPAGTSIDATWERVTVNDPTVGPKRFGRVKVAQTP